MDSTFEIEILQSEDVAQVFEEYRVMTYTLQLLHVKDISLRYISKMILTFTAVR